MEYDDRRARVTAVDERFKTLATALMRRRYAHLAFRNVRFEEAHELRRLAMVSGIR